MSDPLTILMALLIVAVIVYVAYLIVGMFRIDQNLKTIIYVVIAVAALILVLRSMGIYTF